MATMVIVLKYLELFDVFNCYCSSHKYGQYCPYQVYVGVTPLELKILHYDHIHKVYMNSHCILLTDEPCTKQCVIQKESRTHTKEGQAVSKEVGYLLKRTIEIPIIMICLTKDQFLRSPAAENSKRGGRTESRKSEIQPLNLN